MDGLLVCVCLGVGVVFVFYVVGVGVLFSLWCVVGLLVWRVWRGISVVLFVDCLYLWCFKNCLWCVDSPPSL